jgi:hypothetical protein
MITLQKTVTYLGDIEQSPLSEVTLRFLCPVFDYSRPNADELAALREIVSIENIETSHEIKDTSYSIALPARNLIGKQNDVTSFLIYTFQSLRKDNSDINDLLIKIPVQFIANQTVSIGSGSLEALYLIKNIKMLMDGMFGMRLMAFHHNPNPAELAAFLENNVFLLNKEVYSRILPEFKQLSRLTTDFALFNIIQRLMEVNDVVSVQSFEFNDAVNDSLRVILREAEIENPQPVIEFIKTYFAQLFDFSIIIQEIKSLAVAGTFHVKTPDGSDIARDDLFYYHLSLEYLYQTAPSTDKLQVIRYDWQSNEEPIHDNSVPFSFSDATPVILSSIRGSIRVIVKGIDGSILWTKEYKPEDPQLKDLFIELALQRPNRRKPSKRGEVKDGKKLRGQVLEVSKQCSLKDLTIIVQTKKEGDELWRVVAATNTDASGNFSMAYPYGEYIEAQAIVSLTPDSPADIPIKAQGNRDETIADDFLYLLVTNPECPEVGAEKDCDCDTPKKAGRLPDHSDLINSDEYTQDIGGSCLNLSTPNRTLSEYGYTGIVRTSDPDVANYTLVRNLDGSFDLQGGQNKIQRSIVDINNPIRWQDAPEFSKNLSLYQAVTVATGHILHYKAIFKADGYSLGNLLYSLALAPGQKKQMVVIDSAHSLQGAETQYIAQGESLAANLFNERDITDVLSGNINEALSGSSSASTGGISAGLGVAATIGYVSGALGVAGGYSSSNASASQNSSRDTSMFFGEKLRQAIMQNAESYRQLNATVVTTVQEGQQYAVTTDVVANHNHCHALTMMYFEVLRHFAIFQELVNVEECIFVPLLMTNFSTENIYKWSDVLARHLLPMSSNTYLQPFSFLRYRVKHPLIPAFDAIQRRKTDYKFVDFPDGAFSDEPITSVTGYITIKVKIPRPKTKYDRVTSFPIVKREEITNKNGGGIFGALADIVVGERPDKKEWQERIKFTDEHIVIYDNFQEARPADVIEVIKFDNFFNAGSKDDLLWRAISDLCGYSNLEEFLANFFSHKTISQWDTTFNDEIAPMVFEALVDNAITITPFSAIDFTTIGKYNGGERLMRLNFRCDTSLSRKDISSIQLGYTKTVLYPGHFWPFVTFIAENLNINYTTKHYQGYIINKYLGEGLSNGSKPIPTPMNSDEQRNPKKEDEYLELKLIEHLNSNLEHYNKMLWYNLDPDRRYMLLDGFNIQVYNDFGIPAGSRSLASVVKNQLLTITGNSLVFPVAAGYKVSQSYIAEVNEDGETENVSLFDHYKPYTPIPPYRISVPSKGVFLEAVQGQCDACERVKENSSQDWTKFTTEEPTPVLPVQTPVPTITDWKAAFKDFAPPLINIQNAPATPAPGAGLSGLPELLGKSGIFKDITGLDATQQNVIRTYLSNQENAKAFAEMAKNMAMQEHNTQHSDKIMDSLQSAKDSGAINQDDYSKLVKDHLQQQIDGGEARSRQDERESKKLETSPIKSAVDLAQQMGSKVSATESDAKGNTKTIDVGPNPDLQLVGDQYVRPAHTPHELGAIVGEIIAADTLKDQGHIVFTDWRKHVSGQGFDMVSFNPADKSLWIIDNKAQFSGIGNANALTGQAYDSYIKELRTFLEKTWPNKAEAQIALEALDAKRIKLVVSNGFAGEATRFTKGLFEKGLHAFDIRMGKLFFPSAPPGSPPLPPGTPTPPGHAEWVEEFRKLPRKKGVRIGKRGCTSVGPMLLAMAVAGSALYLLKAGENLKQIAGEIILQVGLDFVLSKLPGGLAAGFVIGLESDETSEQRAARKLEEQIDELLSTIPNIGSMSKEERTNMRDVLKQMIENPIIIPEPPEPPAHNRQILPGLWWPSRSQEA